MVTGMAKSNYMVPSYSDNIQMEGADDNTPSNSIQHELKKLHELVCILDDSIGTMAERIEPILGPDSPMTDGMSISMKSPGADIAQSQLLELIRTTSDRVVAITRNVNYTRGRVQL